MRAFVAIEIAQNVVGKFTHLQRELQEAVGGRAVRWVDADAIHITLKFLGDISAEQASRLLQGLGRAAEFTEPFTLSASGLGCFPDCGRARLLWAGVNDDLSALERLQNEIERCAVKLGYAPDRRRFSGHLTIGRVRSGLRRAEADKLCEAVRVAKGMRYAEWRVAEMVLMQSKLGRGGARYGRWACIPFWQAHRIATGQ